MAVVQISKIQLRRGQKNSVSGIPQLSSAEMAWAVDSQELYIGNGAVAEGSPYVGNTRILTEHENLLDLLSSYKFGGDNFAESVPRSMQGKLDETVSFFDFGGSPNNEDNTDQLDIATSTLFSTDTSLQKVLIIPNGTYVFQQDIVIPSNTILQGETPNGVIFNIGNKNISFDGLVGDEIPHPHSVNLTNITIERDEGQVVFTGLQKSAFNNVKFCGKYKMAEFYDNDPAPASANPAAYWSCGAGTIVTDIEFNWCAFENNYMSINAVSGSPAKNSNITFNNTRFVDNHYGTSINGVAGQGNYWRYKDCLFEKIYTHAFVSDNGIGTSILHSEFKNVGNGKAGAGAPEFAMVEFGEIPSNIVRDCTSDRFESANITGANTAAIAEVVNSDQTSFVDRHIIAITDDSINTQFVILAAETAAFKIDYLLYLGGQYRSGQLTIVTSESSDETTISDNYTVSSSDIEDFEFSVVLRDADEDSANETIALSYRNDYVGAAGNLSFNIEYSR